MKIGILLNTRNPETAWNALRFGVTSLVNEHEVKMFLLGSAVEIEEIRDDKFDVLAQTEHYLKAGGKIVACGTCLRMRNKSEIEICPVSSMQGLLEMLEESDKFITFS